MSPPWISHSNLPSFRREQIRKAWFDPRISGWEEVTVLPKELRKTLAHVPWTNVKVTQLQSSDEASKALLSLSDKLQVESVLMINPKGQWTACVSSQVGCAMACDFCATGTMGFIRDLSADEIADQMRYWRRYLWEKTGGKEIVSNVVMMGMGEPLNNFEAVTKAMRSFIEDMGIGKTKITLSTVGVKRGMDRILTDETWPDVRVAISLHYPNQKKRAEHMPVANQRSLEDLKDWCIRYLKKYGNRKHHITFEYLMLQGKNDSEEDIQDLVRFLKGIDRYKLNLIPWNEVNNLDYNRASHAKTVEFQNALKSKGIRSTIRKSLGREIDGGCGQLAVKSPNTDLLSIGGM